MPSTAPQKNRQTNAAKLKPPQPQPDLSTAGTQDHEYALVSVLYHALQGAQACEQYVNDAERNDDPELASFFQDCIRDQQQRATRAKELLAGRIGVEEEDDDDETDDEEESID
jgi:hypothetical protein